MMFEVNTDGKVANKLLKIHNGFHMSAPEYFDKAHVYVVSDVCLYIFDLPIEWFVVVVLP